MKSTSASRRNARGKPKGKPLPLDSLVPSSGPRLVAWYLMTSFLYYKHDISIITDPCYDHMCAWLKDHLDEIDHPHRHLVDKGALDAGTAYHLTEADYPAMTKGAALRLAHEAGYL